MLKSSLLIAMCVFGLAACNPGGFDYPPGTQCAPGYNPFNTAPDGSFQVASYEKPVFGFLKSSGQTITRQPTDLPAGNYTYAQTDLFFQEKAPQNPFMVHMQETWNLDNSMWNPHITCMMNSKVGVQSMNFIGDVIDAMVIPNSTSMQITTRHVELWLANGSSAFCAPGSPPGNTCVPTDNPTKLTTPESLYPTSGNSKPIEYLMVQSSQFPTNNWQFRAHYLCPGSTMCPTGVQGDLYLGSQLNYSPTIPASAAATK